MIKYVNELTGIEPKDLKGFFVDWPNPLSIEKHYELLDKSDYIHLAIDDESQQVVGFITAISDQVLSAYIPLLEVLPSYNGRGIGSELVKRMLDSLKDYYMIDLLCDEHVVPFYQQFKMYKTQGMMFRNYDKQSGK